jgi:hypothetical protein
VDAPESAARASCRDVLDSLTQCLVEWRELRFVAYRCARCLAGSTLAYAIAILQMADQDSPPGRPYHFFEITSLSIVLSSVRSATSRLSFEFSSRNCRNSRISGVPRSPKRFFPKLNGVLVNAELTREFGDRRTALGLPQRWGDLLGRMASAGHREPP